MHRFPLVPLILALLVGCSGKEPAGDDTGAQAVDADQDGSVAGTDCDDADAAVFPGADELCNDRDDDCDGLADEDAIDPATLYADADADGYGDPAAAVTTCDTPSGHVATGDDCDDTDDAVHPGAREVCDDANVDEDCNGAADDADAGVDATTGTPVYADADGDGFGVEATAVTACDAVAGFVAVSGDCDDAVAAVHPDATELCDAGVADEDCDGAVDDADPSVDLASAAAWYEDVDADGYGAPGSLTLACDAPTGFVAEGTDCDDAAAAISPAAAEVCDALDVDEDCDGLADDLDPGAEGGTAWYADADGDGFGDPGVPSEACDQPEAYVADGTDCDDAVGTVFPAAPEQCDGVANDCDGAAAWTPEAEVGVASWIDAAGTASVTSTLAAGTAEAPVSWAPPGDGELRLCDGTFYARVDGSGVDLTVSSLNGADHTALDGGAGGTVLASTGGVLTVTGVTVQNGAGANGGGVYCLASDLAIVDAVLADNAATGSGGGLFLQSCADATLTNVELSGNVAANGGGLYATTSDGLVLDGLVVTGNAVSVVGGGISLSNSDFRLANSAVSGNAAGGSYAAGGVSVASSTGSIDGVTVTDNTAASASGLLVAASAVDLVDSEVSGNVATGYGAAMRAYYGATVTVEGTTFAGNVSGGTAPLYLDSSTAGTFTACTFSANEGAEGGVFGFADGASATIVTSDFADNAPNDAYAAGTAYSFGTAASATCDDVSGCL